MTTTLLHRAVFRFLAAGLALCLAACADQATQSAAPPTITVPNDHLIVPGVRMGPFVLGMSETQLLAMGQPSQRAADYIRMENGSPTSIPAISYCYWDQYICVEVSQADHSVKGIYLDPQGTSTPYRTQSGAGPGYSTYQLSQSFDLGTPDITLTTPDPFHRGYFLATGFDNPSNASVTRFYFINQGWNASETPHTHVRAIAIYSTDIYSPWG